MMVFMLFKVSISNREAEFAIASSVAPLPRWTKGASLLCGILVTSDRGLPVLDFPVEADRDHFLLKG